MNINITKATIFISSIMDQIVLDTDLPSSTLDFNDSKVNFLMYATHGYGEEYVKNNFPNVPIEVIIRN